MIGTTGTSWISYANLKTNDNCKMVGMLSFCLEVIGCIGCRYSDANTMVTAANFANTPSYNAQCGQCLQVTNLEGAGQVYVTIIDYKGASGNA